MRRLLPLILLLVLAVPVVAQLQAPGPDNSLKIGDVVVITGNPGRTAADHRIRMLTLLRPSDEFGWGGAPGEVVD